MPSNTYTTQDLQDNLDYLAETKAQIKNAIIEKGQTIEDSDTFRSYADKIEAIETGIDTSDATARESDVIFPKTFYANGEKKMGNIQCEYTDKAGGIDYEILDESFNKTYNMQDICNEFHICLKGNRGSSCYIYEFNDGVVGELITQIPSSYYGDRLMRHIQVARKLNEEGTLNIFIMSGTSGGNTAYLTAIQYDPETKELVKYTNLSFSTQTNNVGNISVNPIYQNICAVADQYYTVNGVSGHIFRYDPVGNSIFKTVDLLHFHGSGVTGAVCEWDSTGRYVALFTSKLTPQYAIIDYFNNTNFNSYTNIFDLSARSRSTKY